MHRIITGIFVALILSVPAAANPDFDLGPSVGSRAPSIEAPQDETGKPRALETLVGQKGLVLFFFRSASWCPYCQAQLIDLNTGVADLAFGHWADRGRMTAFGVKRTFPVGADASQFGAERGATIKREIVHRSP